MLSNRKSITVCNHYVIAVR